MRAPTQSKPETSPCAYTLRAMLALLPRYTHTPKPRARPHNNSLQLHMHTPCKASPARRSQTHTPVQCHPCPHAAHPTALQPSGSMGAARVQLQVSPPSSIHCRTTKTSGAAELKGEQSSPQSTLSSAGRAFPAPSSPGSAFSDPNHHLTLRVDLRAPTAKKIKAIYTARRK